MHITAKFHKSQLQTHQNIGPQFFFQITSCGTVPGPQSMAFSCFPDSKSQILIWLSSELDAATVCIIFGQGFYHWDGRCKLADITVTRTWLHDLHGSSGTCWYWFAILHLKWATGMKFRLTQGGYHRVYLVHVSFTSTTSHEKSGQDKICE